MRKRRSRRNSWWGHTRLHAKAARKGWGRKRSRRTRRNAGSVSHATRSVTRSIGAGFAPDALKRATAILLGNISTTFYVDQIASRVTSLKTSPVAQIASLLLLSGANAIVAKRFIPKHANDILIGGILAGVTRAAKMVLPGRFATCGLGEDLDGLGMDLDGLGSGYFPAPGNMVINTAGNPMYRLNGMGWAPGPNTPHVMDGLADHLILPDTVPQQSGGRMFTLDGMADAEMQHEIAMQM